MNTIQVKYRSCRTRIIHLNFTVITCHVSKNRTCDISGTSIRLFHRIFQRHSFIKVLQLIPFHSVRKRRILLYHNKGSLTTSNTISLKGTSTNFRQNASTTGPFSTNSLIRVGITSDTKVHLIRFLVTRIKTISTRHVINISRRNNRLPYRKIIRNVTRRRNTNSRHHTSRSNSTYKCRRTLNFSRRFRDSKPRNKFYSLLQVLLRYI